MKNRFAEDGKTASWRNAEQDKQSSVRLRRSSTSSQPDDGMPLQACKVHHATAIVLQFSILINALIGYFHFHDINSLFGTIPPNWIIASELLTSLLSFASLAFHWRRRHETQRKKRDNLWEGALYVFCTAASFMTAELSFAALTKAKSESLQEYMKTVSSKRYGGDLFEAESDAIDHVQKKFSCCGFGTAEPLRFWKETNWFRRQKDYPVQRFPRSCCVTRENSANAQICSTSDSPFCTWVKSPDAEDLCSGNIVPPPGLEWQELVYHQDCYPILEGYIVWYTLRSVLLNTLNIVVFLAFFVVFLNRKESSNYSHVLGQIPSVVLVNDLGEQYNIF
uniref:Tetraspanin n=1 Tax=Steinernema glaseri TaxID=37863 RepID=A0A1I8A4P0_9BILA